MGKGAASEEPGEFWSKGHQACPGAVHFCPGASGQGKSQHLTSPPPTEERLSAFGYFSSGTLFPALAPHIIGMGYPDSQMRRETQWQEKSSCHKNRMKMPKGLLPAFANAHLP